MSTLIFKVNLNDLMPETDESIIIDGILEYESIEYMSLKDYVASLKYDISEEKTSHDETFKYESLTVSLPADDETESDILEELNLKADLCTSVYNVTGLSWFDTKIYELKDIWQEKQIEIERQKESEKVEENYFKNDDLISEKQEAQLLKCSRVETKRNF